jgi:hypothetical protein
MTPRLRSAILASSLCMLAACSGSGYAVRPVPRIAADNVGRPIGRLQEAFGEPRKVDTTPTKQIYVWFIAQAPAGAPAGFHGCELEVTVEPNSQHVLGYSMSNIGWTKCGEIARRVRIAAG